MEQLHAHEVLHMMEGNSYTELSLREDVEPTPTPYVEPDSVPADTPASETATE